MKIGLLGWDHGEVDVDAPVLEKVGRDLGYDVSLFTLDDVGCRPSASGGIEVMFGDEPAPSFDVVLSRAQLRDEHWQTDVDLLDLASHVPGVPILDPVEVWIAAESKFGMMQRLGDAGLPVPPTRLCRTPGDVEAAWQDWGPFVVKPAHGFGGNDVVRVLSDLPSELPGIQTLLGKYGMLVAQPYYDAPEGDMRITVVGSEPAFNLRRIPQNGGWRSNYAQGARIEAVDPPADLVDIAVRASHLMGVSVAGVDLLLTTDGFRLMEVNTVPGGLYLLGEDAQRHVMEVMYQFAADAASSR